MSNLHQALYKMVSKYIQEINADIDSCISCGGTAFDLEQIKKRVNHIQDMMDVVLGDDTNER